MFSQREDTVEIMDRIEKFPQLLCMMDGYTRNGSGVLVSGSLNYFLKIVITYGAIEFRQAIGTANAGGILGWIQIVTKFAMVAMEIRNNSFIDWVEGGNEFPNTFNGDCSTEHRTKN